MSVAMVSYSRPNSFFFSISILPPLFCFTLPALRQNSEQQQSINVPEVITVLSGSEEGEERAPKRARQNSQQRRPPRRRPRQMEQSIEVITILSSSEEEEEEEGRGSKRAATSSSIGEAEELGRRHSVGGGELSERLEFEFVELSSDSDDGEDSDVVPDNVSTDDDEEAADPGEGPGGGGGGGAAAAASFAGPTCAHGVKQKQREAHAKNVAMLAGYTVLSKRTSRPGTQLPMIENAITKTVTSMIKSYSTMLDIILMKAPEALPCFLLAFFGVGTAAELTSGQAFSRGYGKSSISEAYVI